MKTLKSVIKAFALSTVFWSATAAQNPPANDEMKAVLAQDSMLWMYYNACEIEKMRSLFTEDLEFYHDMGGTLKGLEEFIAKSQKNLCSNDNFKVRREAVPGTVNAFPLKNQGIVYGAILTGEHVFYILEKGKEARLDGHAKFTHLFLKTESGWKMSRILSYNHRPPQYVNKRKEVLLNQQILQQHAGSYQAPNTGLCIIKQQGNLLDLIIGDQVFRLHPETETKFFVTDRDLTVEFLNNKMIVRENGNIVEEAARKN